MIVREFYGFTVMLPFCSHDALVIASCSLFCSCDVKKRKKLFKH